MYKANTLALYWELSSAVLFLSWKNIIVEMYEVIVILYRVHCVYLYYFAFWQEALAFKRPGDSNRSLAKGPAVHQMVARRYGGLECARPECVAS